MSPLLPAELPTHIFDRTPIDRIAAETTAIGAHAHDGRILKNSQSTSGIRYLADSIGSMNHGPNPGAVYSYHSNPTHFARASGVQPDRVLEEAKKTQFRTAQLISNVRCLMNTDATKQRALWREAKLQTTCSLAARKELVSHLVASLGHMPDDVRIRPSDNEIKQIFREADRLGAHSLELLVKIYDHFAFLVSPEAKERYLTHFLSHSKFGTAEQQAFIALQLNSMSRQIHSPRESSGTSPTEHMTFAAFRAAYLGLVDQRSNDVENVYIAGKDDLESIGVSSQGITMGSVSRRVPQDY